MAIIQSLPCPACQANGHDSRGNHLLVFEDGGKYCGKIGYHKDGLPYYEGSEGGTKSVLDGEITGKIAYTPRQFRELESTGRLVSPAMRAHALAGMRGQDRWEVMNDDERKYQQALWASDKEFYDGLKTKSLIDRHIHGTYAKLYGVRVGHDEAGQVNRHYYPVYEEGEWKGCKCRTLPKDFRFGHLGHMWGKRDMFGMQTMQAVLDSGTRKHKLLVVGGECDAMSAQQMLCDSQKGTSYEGKLFHIWSVPTGETAVQDLIDNREYLDQFKEIVWGFDDDDTGKALTRDAYRMFPTKSRVLLYPPGAKDANDCLKKGLQKEFVDSWFNPSEVNSGSKIKTVRQLSSKAKIAPVMGKSWPWPSMNKITLGIRKYMMYLFGAGTGVGKTATTKQIVKHLIDVHEESVGVIYTEEPATQTVRSYAGKWINKRLELPPCNDVNSDMYGVDRDYTEEQANAAIDALDARGMLYVVDLEGDNGIDTVMAACEELVSLGIQNIVIDNLTGISMKEGNGNKVDAIDEALKRIGNFKDEKPVSIFLYSHLRKQGQGRKPHEEGGEVELDDFRGSGAIKFWANYAFGIRRNTKAETLEEKCMTFIECLKDRDMGIMTGEKVLILGDPNTGNLLEPRDHIKPAASITCETEQVAANESEGDF